MTDNRNALSTNPTRRRYSVAIALGVVLAVMAYSPASANQAGYEPPVNGGPARTQGSGTR